MEHGLTPFLARIRLGVSGFNQGELGSLARFMIQADTAQRLFETNGTVGAIIGPFLLPVSELPPTLAATDWYRRSSKEEHLRALDQGFKFYNALYDAKEHIWKPDANRLLLHWHHRMGTLKKLAMPRSKCQQLARRSQSTYQGSPTP